MKFFLLLLLGTANAFISPSVTRVRRLGWTVLKATDEKLADDLALDDIAHKLRLNVFDVNTGVYGMESKDPLYGIENIRAKVHTDPSLGLELVEVAHSDLDHRGLVLVSKVDGNAVKDTRIHVGDTIIGVFAGTEFKESTTGLDYDDTFDVISRAKKHALERGMDSISLELNRVVKKAKVMVEIEDENGLAGNIEALAGDNLRLLLMHHHAKLYDEGTHRLDQPNLTGDCGGEGICGTCLVAVRQGMSHLNEMGPQEESIMKNRPRTWRAACKTVVGADNQEGSTIRIRLHPQTSPMEDELLHP